MGAVFQFIPVVFNQTNVRLRYLPSASHIRVKLDICLKPACWLMLLVLMVVSSNVYTSSYHSSKEADEQHITMCHNIIFLYTDFSVIFPLFVLSSKSTLTGFFTVSLGLTDTVT